MLTRRSRFVVSFSAAAVLVAAVAATEGRAAVTADAVLSYGAGVGAKTAYWGAPLDDASVALGLPSSNHNVPDIYSGTDHVVWADHTVLSPFNAAYAPDEVVSFGGGGEITLHLSAPVPTGGGPTLGVHTGTALADSTITGAGVNLGDAATYTDDRVATVEVSADNATWYSLGSVTFSLPSNYYSAGLASPYGNGPGTAVADFSKPFTGQLSDFDEKDWQGTLDVLAGSGGGTWLDLSTATGPGALPASIQYVRFSLPAGSSATFVLDAVTAVPEPVSLGLILAGAAAVMARRRSR